jgi:alpha-1,6-mannosyltransferase
LLEFLKPDRIEVSDRFTLIKVGKWAKRMKISSVVFSHETLAGLAKRFFPFIPSFIRERFVNQQNRRLARSFDKVVVTTKFAGDEFTKINISNLFKISLGVDLIGFNPSFKSNKLKRELVKNSDYLMIYCGRLSPEKEPMRVLEAHRSLLDRGIKVRLVVLGGGAMWNKFRAVAKELPVEMVGYVASREKIANYLSCADVAIAPGPLETFCLSALESLASGVPVVASASSAVGEILNSSGIERAGLTANNDGESFANAIEQILNDKSFQRNARSCAENFAWSNTISQMIELHDAKPPMVTVRRRLKVA